jgi:hypothetical protein
MENIKAKDLLIKSINNEEFVPLTTRPSALRKFGWRVGHEARVGKDQLSLTEVTEFIYNEACRTLTVLSQGVYLGEVEKWASYNEDFGVD